eukprot:1161857-Pelagomonas_calceolata.AAC.6
MCYAFADMATKSCEDGPLKNTTGWHRPSALGMSSDIMLPGRGGLPHRSTRNNGIKDEIEVCLGEAALNGKTSLPY